MKQLMFVFLLASCGEVAEPVTDSGRPCSNSGEYSCSCTISTSSCADYIVGAKTWGMFTTWDNEICDDAPWATEIDWVNVDGKGSLGCWLKRKDVASYKGPETIYVWRQMLRRCAGQSPCDWVNDCWCTKD